jgi:hypothetical protein
MMEAFVIGVLVFAVMAASFGLMSLGILIGRTPLSAGCGRVRGDGTAAAPCDGCSKPCDRRHTHSAATAGRRQEE